MPTRARAMTAEFAYMSGLLDIAFSRLPTLASVWRLVPNEAITDRDTAFLHQWLGEFVAADQVVTPAKLTGDGDRFAVVRGLVMEIMDSERWASAEGLMTVDKAAAAVRAAYRRDRVAKASAVLEEIAGRPNATIEQLEAVQCELSEAMTCVVAESRKTRVTLIDAVHEWMQAEAVPVVPTGFSPVDALADGGLPIGGLVVLAAPPSVGKSALALQLAIGAIDHDESLSVVWCLGEMTLPAFARRAVCYYSTRQGRKVTMTESGAVSLDARGTGAAMAANIGGQLTILQPPLTPATIEAAVEKSGARLLVVDYVQLVESAGAQDRRAEVDAVVKAMRRLSIERKLAVILVSNISKAVGSDTRIGAIGKESSELDYAADILLLGSADEPGTGVERPVRWACKKNRHGECREIVTHFDGRYQSFRADDYVEPYDDFSSFSPRASSDQWEA